MFLRKIKPLELVLAVALLSTVGTLTVPRFGRASSEPQRAALLRTRLQTLRIAIEQYAQDHDALPAQNDDGQNPAGTAAAFIAQLTQPSDAQGRVAITRDKLHRFGPYLRDGIPTCPVPPCEGRSGVYVVVDGERLDLAPDAQAGWVYCLQTGRIIVNSDVADAEGRSFMSY